MLGFRVWDKESKSFMDGEDDECFILFATTNGDVHFANEYEDRYNIKNLVVMHETGLKDKYNKCIFSGDVVEVTLSYSSLRFSEIKIKLVDNVPLFLIYYGTKNGCVETLEILGNIYENPELESLPNLERFMGAKKDAGI